MVHRAWTELGTIIPIDRLQLMILAENKEVDWDFPQKWKQKVFMFKTME